MRFDTNGMTVYILTSRTNRSKLMKQIQASEAKAKFSELLDAVENGETIEITRHGKPIARIVPDEGHRRERVRQAIEQMQEARKNGPRATIEEILAWRDEGRR
jgi:prevent-host-death family protein